MFNVYQLANRRARERLLAAVVAQLWSGDAPGRNATVMNYIFPNAPQSDGDLARLDEMSDFFFDVVEQEDYHMGLRVQQGLEAISAGHVTFERNEIGNQYFHRWVDYYLAEGHLLEPTLRHD